LYYYNLFSIDGSTSVNGHYKPLITAMLLDARRMPMATSCYSPNAAL